MKKKGQLVTLCGLPFLPIRSVAVVYVLHVFIPVVWTKHRGMGRVEAVGGGCLAAVNLVVLSSVSAWQDRRYGSLGDERNYDTLIQYYYCHEGVDGMAKYRGS